MPARTKRSQSKELQYSFLAARKAVLLQDQEYFFYLLERIRKARYSVDCTIFIVDAQPSLGGVPTAEILDALAYAHWLGLEVRVLLGHSAQSADIDMACRVSLAYLRFLEVPTRFARPSRRSSLHSKYAIVDRREVLLGSHNWAYFDLFASKQTSIAVDSPHLAQRLTRRFQELWEASETEP